MEAQESEVQGYPLVSLRPAWATRDPVLDIKNFKGDLETRHDHAQHSGGRGRFSSKLETSLAYRLSSETVRTTQGDLFKKIGVWRDGSVSNMPATKA